MMSLSNFFFYVTLSSLFVISMILLLMNVIKKPIDFEPILVLAVVSAVVSGIMMNVVGVVGILVTIIENKINRGYENDTRDN
jgi:hypothetical protein